MAWELVGRAALQVVTVATGDEARPVANIVFWMGGSTRPANMAEGDVWVTSEEVIAPTGTAPTITTTSLGALTVGTAFSQAIAASGDTPLTWGISAGNPVGLQVNSSTGVLSGTPTTAGPYDFTVEAVNSAGMDTQQFTGTVAAQPAGNLHKVFGTTAPDPAMTNHNDGGTVRVANQFYTYGTEPTGWRLVGVRLWVPAGAVIPATATVFHCATTGSIIPNLNAPSQSATMPTVAGQWNEVMFATPIPITPGSPFYVGYQFANGAYSLASKPGVQPFILAADGSKIALAESSGGLPRGVFSVNGGSSGQSFNSPIYGLDVLMDEGA